LRHYYSAKEVQSITLKLQSINVAKSLFCKEQNQMLDLILLALGLGFFALSVGYTIACDRL
jgi:hypothetical protein